MTTIELLVEKPLFKTNTVINIFTENLSVFCKADLGRIVKGYAKSNIKKLNKNNGIYERAFKDTQQTLKGYEYIKQIFEKETLYNVDFSKTSLFGLKNDKEFRNQLTKEDLIEVNKVVIEELKNLQVENDKNQMKELERELFCKIIEMLGVV